MALKPTHRQSLGRWGEQVATSYLLQQGYTLLERNARTPYGEIDLVMRHASPPASLAAQTMAEAVVVFVEVKTRSSTKFGFPEAAITVRKRAHLLAAIEAYLTDHPELDCDWRVDVIAILRASPGCALQLKHFENALS